MPTPLHSDPYRRVTMRKGEPGEDWSAWMAAGWELLCSECGRVFGRLFMPFSGGYILAGSVSRLDGRLVERPGPETKTGHGYRRYGLPQRGYTKRPFSVPTADGEVAALRRHRSDKASGSELVINGAFWVYCPECNTGQAVEPELLTR
jgi:hypothetical protein